MKRLTISALVLVLAASSGAALADRGGWHGDRGHGHGHYKHGHYNRGWYPRPYYRPVYYYPRPVYYGNYYEPLGAAMIGAAITYSIVHSHDSYSGSSSSRDVVGCHRIERYPNGSERRVEVPLEECY